jgi:hypothetical protein
MYMRDREKAPVRKVNIPTEMRPARGADQDHRVGAVIAARREEVQQEAYAGALDGNLLIILIDTVGDFMVSFSQVRA